MVFPYDENGNVLRRLAAKGDDLSRARNVDFSVVFPDRESAEQFCEIVRGWGLAASAQFPGPVADLPWDVNVVKFMTPSHQEISDFEILLEDTAGPLGGHNDGWGCFSMPKENRGTIHAGRRRNLRPDQRRPLR